MVPELRSKESTEDLAGGRRLRQQNSGIFMMLFAAAPGRRFLRHGGIYRSDVSSHLADQGRSAERNRHVSGEGLQPKASSLRTRLPASGRVRRPASSGRGGADMKATVRFFRHGEICRPMCSCFKNLDRSTAFRPGSAQTVKDAPEVLRPTHRRDDFRPAIPQRVARQQSPPPLYRHAHPKSVPGSGTMNLQRTVNSVLTVCLSPGDHPKAS